MKARIWVAVIAALWGGCLAARGAGLRVGAGTAEFVADDSMVIAGGIGPGRATGQEGQLRAVAVVLEQAPFGKLAIVACDVLFVRGDMVREAREKIAELTGIAPERVLINATHTHSAPSTIRVHGCEPEEAFVRSVVQGMVDSVVRANDRLVDNCTFKFALGEEKTVGANSRLLLSDKFIYWVGSRDDAVGPTGPFDPQLPVWAFEGPDGKLVALIYNHSTHSIGSVKPNVRSPIFYGLAAQELEQELGCTVCFLEGASGSTHNITGVTPADAVVRMKDAIRQALARAEVMPVDRLGVLERAFRFRVRTIDEAVEEDKVVSYCRKRVPSHADGIIPVFRQMRLELKPHQGEERQTVLQTIVIGPVALAGVPAEYFTQLGMDIKQRSPVKYTFVAELANDWIGYLPNREAHELGGYQTWMGLHSYAEVGTGERIVDEIVSMLGAMTAER